MSLYLPDQLQINMLNIAPSPIPKLTEGNVKSSQPTLSGQDKTDEAESLVAPPLPTPTLRLHLNDLTHSATKAFLRLIPDPSSVLKSALSVIVTHLYTSPSKLDSNSRTNHIRPSFTPSIPPTRSVTVILHDFSGVAYTTGTDLDSDHKEIHFSLSYIDKTTSSFKDPLSELVGVLTHELVHCYQHTSPPSSDPESIPQAPSGLVEGIADFVRLKASLNPPHWTRPSCAADLPESWDQGYEHTAYFLEWLEDVKIGTGAIGMLNDRLLRVGYVGEGTDDSDKEKGNKNDAGPDGGKENTFWVGLFGLGVLELWRQYGAYLDNLEEGKKPTKDQVSSADNL
jgi:hypothetical protein